MYTIKQLNDAVSSSISLREVLFKLNLKQAGGNYTTLKRKIQENNINTSHFLGQRSNSGSRHRGGRKLNLSEYLIKDSKYQSFKLRNRLIKENIFTWQCSSCKNTEWMNQKIPLELEHINGVNSDNRLENLTLLCPNCHALTSTYRGRNISKLSSGLPD
jgi:5-methylcytosine-specific restriction endonuclease McrA